MLRTGKSIETKSKLIIAWGQGKGSCLGVGWGLTVNEQKGSYRCDKNASGVDYNMIVIQLTKFTENHNTGESDGINYLNKIV